MKPDELGIRRLAVIGLGKLGACIAAAFAARGFEVIGFDVDRHKTDALARRVAPVEEPDLQEAIDEAGPRLKATNDVCEAVDCSDASFFVPPTPSLDDGSFSNQCLMEALQAVAQAVRKLGKRRYLFVVNSTVTPGTSDRVLKPLLEHNLLGRCGQDFGLCYNPEFIALGDVIRGLFNPDLVLIGESDAISGQLIEKLYKRFCKNTPPIERMSNTDAELAKISVNCAVTMKISFVNQLSAVCAKIPGANPGVILKAIGNDRRIGHSYLKPGLGFGGPCFPRDNRLFQYTSRSVGVEAPLAEATDRVNEGVNQRLLETVLAHCKSSSVAVLGLAYKPFTGVTDCSPGIWLCQQLAKHGRKVFAHDYLAVANAQMALSNGQVQTCEDAREILQKGCQTFAITCPWPRYRELFESAGADVLKPGTVIVDPWSILDGIGPGLENVRHISLLS